MVAHKMKGLRGGGSGGGHGIFGVVSYPFRERD